MVIETVKNRWKLVRKGMQTAWFSYFLPGWLVPGLVCQVMDSLFLPIPLHVSKGKVVQKVRNHGGLVYRNPLASCRAAVLVCGRLCAV